MLKGNDYLLIWLLAEPDGTPIDYNQFESYKVFIQNDSNKSYKYEVVTAALDDGLHFDFKSDMQKSTGYYSLIFEAVKDGRNYKAENYRGIHIDGNVDRSQNVVSPSNSTIKLTDCLSLYLGGRDGRSPYVGVNNHWWVFNDLSKMYADTGIKVDYSSDVNAQITLAEQAITRVNQTNQTVSENETARSQNEAIREQDERTRVANEAKRVGDEKVRVANEAKRAEDEAVRISDETTRKDSEAARVNNEAARVSGEDVRVRNEASRTSEESTRVSNENARKSNEITRVNAESSRVSAEQSRVTEEGKRVTAENKRQTDTAKAIQDTNTATDAANNAANTVDTKVAEAIKPIEASKLDRAEFDLQRQPVYGLGFKSGDNTVNLKTPEINLGLNDFTVELWMRMEGGCIDTSGNYSVFGAGRGIYANNAMCVYAPHNMGSNGLQYITQGSGVYASLAKVNKTDSTKNLHHIVIIRTGGTITSIVNGRKISTGNKDTTTDYTDFLFSIANTTYFSLGRVFNYAMSQEEAVGLWNGGRVDEVVLDNKYKKLIPNYTPSSFGQNGGTVSDLGNGVWQYSNSVVGVGSRGLYFSAPSNTVNKMIEFTAKIKILTKNASVISDPFEVATRWQGAKIDKNIDGSIINDWQDIKVVGVKKDTIIVIYFGNQTSTEPMYQIKDVIVKTYSCYLELLPQNIHSSGIYNTGSLGSSHDAVLSKPDETTFIKEKPYKDKQMSVGAPSFHPIAMGQKVYSDTGLIYEAAIPPTSREWSTADWKQVNNN